MIKSFLFDFDGTLVDSMPFWWKLDSEFLTSRGIEPNALIHRILWSMSVSEMSQYLHDRFRLPESPAEIAEILKQMMKPHYENDIILKPGVLEVLQSLREKDIKIGILSLSSHVLVEPYLTKWGIGSYFSAIFSSDDLGMPKKEPNIYNYALKQFHVCNGQTVLVEDSLYAIRVGEKVGMKTVGIYEKYAEEEWPLVCKEADETIENYSEWEKVEKKFL